MKLDKEFKLKILELLDHLKTVIKNQINFILSNKNYEKVISFFYQKYDNQKILSFIQLA